MDIVAASVVLAGGRQAGANQSSSEGGAALNFNGYLQKLPYSTEQMVSGWAS